MTNQQHPITPPPELVQQWWTEFERADFDDDSLVFVATQAARWGADQELNECCKWLPKLPPWSADDLRKHRRPKPPSLKEQALESLHHLEAGCEPNIDLLRRALEQLDD